MTFDFFGGWDAHAHLFDSTVFDRENPLPSHVADLEMPEERFWNQRGLTWQDFASAVETYIRRIKEILACDMDHDLEDLTSCAGELDLWIWSSQCE